MRDSIPIFRAVDELIGEFNFYFSFLAILNLLNLLNLVTHRRTFVHPAPFLYVISICLGSRPMFSNCSSQVSENCEITSIDVYPHRNCSEHDCFVRRCFLWYVHSLNCPVLLVLMTCSSWPKPCHCYLP